ncbi:DUF1329 domain-containing protein [uncultured Abyssibacter sp.]|uniref:DUF1329 domain-containing protein n=1 Tax=uncultured Abyssibacter sp. TaxID=2320202 RepID=UPI0032B20589
MSSRMTIAILAGMASAGSSAAVTQQEADRLGQDLTPVGATMAGDEALGIPAWDGGLQEVPRSYKGAGTRYTDPFPDDRPEFTITADNLDQYRDRLTVGQIALFERFPETYVMPVYATRRTFANPQFIYDATRKNAVNAQLGGGGDTVTGAVTGVPFPIPKNGHEVIWNHKTRYRDFSVRRWNNQAAVTSTGSYNLVKLREDVTFRYSQPGIEPRDLDNVLLYFLQITTQPPRLAGQILLVHETMDQLREPRAAWLYNPGQRRLRRAPNVAYDNPGTGSDGLRTNDQTDTFNGAMDRYDWKLIGKTEIYTPYNSYKIHSDEYSYDDIIQRGHIDQDLTRYELHRVWIVDATLKAGTSHIYKRRTFYVDEDSWQIVAVDIYDKRDELWRVQETHTAMAYDVPYMGPILESVYDLLANRYLVQAMNNEDDETYSIDVDWETYFNPSNVKKLARR